MGKRNPHVIVYNDHTGRFEVWHESREVAHSSSLKACVDEYPQASVSTYAKEMDNG